MTQLTYDDEATLVFVNDEIHHLRLELTDAGARTVYYALGEYKKNLLADIDGLENKPEADRVSDNLEEETFLHGEVAKVSRLMFEIAYNHDSWTAENIRNWMGL